MYSAASDVYGRLHSASALPDALAQTV